MLPTKPINVRLGGELEKRFKTLRAEFAGLPPSTILRMLIAAQLAKPLSDQIEIVQQQIRRPGALERPRRNSLNSKERLTREE